MTIKSETIKNFRVDFNEFKELLEEKYGLKINIGNISFNDYGFTTKMTCMATSGDILDDRKNEWNRECRKIGLKEEDFGKVFELGESYEIVGIRPRARKNNIIVVRKDNGKEYVMDHYTIKDLLYGNLKQKR